MMENPSALVSELESEVGDGLRAVGEYSEEGYELHYVREDVKPRIEEVNVERVHRELVLEGLGKEYLEELFDAGRLRCSVHRFEEMTSCHFVRTETTGGYVSIDSDADVRFDSFVETCRRHL